MSYVFFRLNIDFVCVYIYLSLFFMLLYVLNKTKTSIIIYFICIHELRYFSLLNAFIYCMCMCSKFIYYMYTYSIKMYIQIYIFI